MLPQVPPTLLVLPDVSMIVMTLVLSPATVPPMLATPVTPTGPSGWRGAVRRRRDVDVEGLPRGRRAEAGSAAAAGFTPIAVANNAPPATRWVVASIDVPPCALPPVSAGGPPSIRLCRKLACHAAGRYDPCHARSSIICFAVGRAGGGPTGFSAGPVGICVGTPYRAAGSPDGGRERACVHRPARRRVGRGAGSRRRGRAGRAASQLEVVLPHAGPQVEQHRRDRHGAGLDARLDHRLELLGPIGEAGQDRRHQHAARHAGLVELGHRLDPPAAGAACPARWCATPPRRACRSRRLARTSVRRAASASRSRSRRISVDLVRMENGLAASASTSTMPRVRRYLPSHRW